MFRKFWTKRKSSEQILIEELKKEMISLKEGYTSIVSSLGKIDEGIYKNSEQLSENSEKIDKGSRLQYRKTNDIIGKLNKIYSSINEAQQIQARYELELKQKESLRENISLLTKVLIKMLDDIDIACDKEPDGHQDNWYKLHKIWQNQILEELNNIGVREINVQGNSFDPSLAEALDTMTREQIKDSIRVPQPKEEYLPFEVIKVIKRGFILSDGSLLRKALVITIREEDL